MRVERDVGEGGGVCAVFFLFIFFFQFGAHFFWINESRLMLVRMSNVQD